MTIRWRHFGSSHSHNGKGQAEIPLAPAMRLVQAICFLAAFYVPMVRGTFVSQWQLPLGACVWGLVPPQAAAHSAGPRPASRAGAEEASRGRLQRRWNGGLVNRLVRLPSAGAVGLVNPLTWFHDVLDCLPELLPRIASQNCFPDLGAPGLGAKASKSTQKQAKATKRKQKQAKASKSKQKRSKASKSKQKQAKASKSKQKQAKASKSKQKQAKERERERERYTTTRLGLTHSGMLK